MTKGKQHQSSGFEVETEESEHDDISDEEDNEHKEQNRNGDENHDVVEEDLDGIGDEEALNCNENEQPINEISAKADGEEEDEEDEEEEDDGVVASRQNGPDDTNRRSGIGRRGGRSNTREKTRKGHDSSDDDEEASDDCSEEDSSDMDAQECEKKRLQVFEDLGNVEKHFSILREQLYRERMTQIEGKLCEVKAGKAVEYLQPLEELQLNVKNRLEVGSVLRELKLTNIQCKYDAELIANEQNFLSEKDLLIDSIKEDLEEKIHILEEDKHNVDLSSGLWELNTGKSRRRKADPMDPDRRKKPVTVTGPYVVYMLNDEKILDDWTAIKKSLTQRKKLKG